MYDNLQGDSGSRRNIKNYNNYINYSTKGQGSEFMGTISTDPHSIVRKMINDMRFVSVFTIIYGVLCCISVIGLIVGIPIIVSGTKLRNAAKEFESYLQFGDIGKIFKGFELQGSYFFINKVFIIIGLVFFILYIGFIVILISTDEFASFFDLFR